MSNTSRLLLRKNFTFEDLLKAIWQLPLEKQLALADEVRNKVLRKRWNDFMKRKDSNPEISDEEIITEVKSVRAALYARRKK